MISIVGYLAYGLIVGFNAIQWFYMVRGKTINLGALPMWSLVFGLALLQVTLVWPLVFSGFAPPTYIIVGNALSFIFAALGLERVVRTNLSTPEPTFLQLQDGTVLQVIAVTPPPVATAPSPVPGASFSIGSAVPGPRTVDQMREHFSGEVDSTIGRMEGHLATWKDNGFPPHVGAHEHPTADEALLVDLS
jgi:hypothetical protein